jgi:hypothetical protein
MTVNLARATVALLTLPPTVAHELTHAVVSKPWADRQAIADPLSLRPTCQVWWREGAPQSAVAFAALAPLILGVLVGLAAIAWVFVEGRVPATAEDWLTTAVAAIWWGIYVSPSRSDLATALDD